MSKIQTTKHNKINEFVEARNTARKLFNDIAHRLEHVADIEDVEFINDSKATDIDSTYYSLELMDKPINWIVGASEYEENYNVLAKLVKYKVVSIVCFGGNANSVNKQLGNLVEKFWHTPNLEEAVLWAWKNADRHSVVLFSPANSSFEMFNNFAERGDKFKEIVKKLK